MSKSTSKSTSKSRTVNAWYGWRPDKPDHRDFIFRPRALPTGPIPDTVDLRSLFEAMPCYDQGELGSCTANAIAAALEFDQRYQKEEAATPSRLFIYYNERAMEGTIKEDAGAEIRDGVKSVNLQGAPPESSSLAGTKQTGCWPYKPSKFKSKPPKACYTAAKKHQSVIYERVQTQLQAMLECLASGFPFVFGFTVYQEFESDEVAKTGILNLPSANEKDVGGHAVLCVGYDKPTERFIVRNSWGTDWGQNGYFTMPFAYLTNDNLADDFWVIRSVE